MDIDRRQVLRSAVAAGLLTATPGLTACGSSGRDRIRFQQNKPEVVEYFGSRAKDFNGAQSAVSVFHDSSPTNITAQVVRGSPPDIALYNYNLETGVFVERGVLTDLADTDGAGLIDPSGQALVDQYATYRGQTSVLPYSVTAAGVVYNVELFEKHRVPVPTTWSELIEACKTFQAAGITPIYQTYKEGWTTQQGVWDYVTGGSVDVATFFAELKEAGPEAVAMYLQGPWSLGEIAKVDPDLRVGTFPLPATDDPDETRCRVNLDLALWIPVDSSDHEASRAFLDYLMEPGRINDYNAKNLAYSPLKNPPTVEDPRIEGLQRHFRDGRFYQGAGTYIPTTIPLENYLQELMITGNGEQFLDKLDSDWTRLARRAA